MCRLLGILSSERTDFHFSLHAAPRSLSSLSLHHPHGWGVAVFDAADGWRVQKRPVRAGACEHFQKTSSTIVGELLVAHVRARTVGEIKLENTHPFRCDKWLFAHNGTIDNLAFLRRHTSPERLGAIGGQTDSELFFAYLLTRFDEAGVTRDAASMKTDTVLLAALQDALSQPRFGACNFLLSDGDTLYAHRFGRTLFLLEKRPSDRVRVHRESHETGAAIDTPWTPQRHAILIASEEMTEEPWLSVEEGTLLRCDRAPLPSFRLVGTTLSN